uniref:Skp1-related protein n=1 Tax=Steinernema glaseri TaxID=37863 RepID=A0A1I7Z4G7_9BILA
MPRYVVVSNDGRRFRISPEALQLTELMALKDDASSATSNEADEPEQVELNAPVEGSTLQLLLEWCEHYRHPQQPPTIPDGDWGKMKISDWDTNFLRSLNNCELQQLTMAAKHLKVRPLLALCIRYIYTAYVRDQTVEKIRMFFGEVDDFSYEEKEYMRYEREWLNGNDVF